MSNNVEVTEAIAIRVGNFLGKSRFFPATINGMAATSLAEARAIGILYQDPDAKPKRSFFGLIVRRSRRMSLGVVQFESDRRWLFRMYGRKYVALVTELCQNMAEVFSVDITIALVAEEPREETIDSDFAF